MATELEEKAFELLDRLNTESDSINFVGIIHLRRELGCDRAKALVLVRKWLAKNRKEFKYG